ncbi:pilus assembly protein TadG-related protein, partial [Salipiger bermudensis]
MLRDESGSVTAATAVLLPGILIGMAMLFDLLWLNNHRSHLQAQADMAALEAARYTGERPSAVRQARVSVAVNDSFRAERLASRQIELGRWQDGSFSDMDAADPRRPNAARVTVRSEAKTNLTALLRRGFDAPFERKAVARAQ